MTDELFDFNSDDSSDQEAQESTGDQTEATPEQQQEAVSIDKTQWEQTQQQIAAQEQWRKDASRFFSGEQTQQQQVDPLTQLVQDPNAWQSQVVNQATQEAVQAMKQEQVISEYRQKFGTQAPIYESLIDKNQDQILADFQSKKGRQPTDLREFLDHGVQYAQGVLKNSGLQVQQSPQKLMAMQPDVSGGQPFGNPQPKLSELSREEFYRHYNQKGRETAGY